MKHHRSNDAAVHAEPDILILDEELSVGDAKFQQKAQLKIQEFFRQGKTILVVTHWLEFIRKNCHRILTMERGKTVRDGTTKDLGQYVHRNGIRTR